MYPADGETIRDAITAMQTLPIVGISQKEGGTQLKLIIEFEDGGQVGGKICVWKYSKKSISGLVQADAVPAQPGDVAQPLLLHGLRAPQRRDRRLPPGQAAWLSSRHPGDREDLEHHEGDLLVGRGRPLEDILHLPGRQPLLPR